MSSGYDASLKSPLCSCVSITVPASSQTRITASCERLRNVLDCVADCVLFAIPQPVEWQHIGNQIDAAMIFARPVLRKRALRADVAAMLGWLRGAVHIVRFL